MQTQNKKAKVLSQRTEKVNKLFTEIEGKLSYCNLKAQSRRMLQPMLNLQQEFIRQKYNKQYGNANNPNLAWSNLESTKDESPQQYPDILQTNNDEDKNYQIHKEFIVKKILYIKKLKRAVRKRHNYSLNDVIQKESEQVQPQYIQTDEQVSDSEDQNKDQFEEYKGCSWKHSVKQVQQKVTFYEKEFRQDLKSLPKLQEKNDFIRRITSTNLVTQELKKARKQSNHRIQQYLIEDFKKYKEEKKLNECMFTENKDNCSQSNLKIQPSNCLKKVTPDMDNQKESKVEVEVSDNTNGGNESRQYSAFKHQYDIEKRLLIKNQYHLPTVQEKNLNSNEQIHQRKKNNSVLFSEQGDMSNRSNSNGRYGQNRDKQSTCVTRQQEDTFQSIQRSEYGLDTSISHSKIRQFNDENEYEQEQMLDKTPVKKAINFEKMYGLFQLNKLKSPANILPKGNGDTKSRDQSFSNQKEIVKFPQQKSFSRNSSYQNLIGGSTANNSYISNFSQISQDKVIQSGVPSSQNSNSYILSHNKPFLDSKALAKSQNIIKSIGQSNLKKRYNLPQEQQIPDFVSKMKDLILGVEELGDNPLTGDQTTGLTNILGLISLHKDTINNTGKSVVDYTFDNSKEHFIIPQRSREHQLNITSTHVPAYGSIAMLDKIYQVNLPSIYILQGAGRAFDKIK